MKNLINKKIENKKDILPNSISDHGVTLISLVITIIILIILAGVVINLGLGQNGIFRRAKQAKEQYSLSEAREKLETVLMEAVIEKETNENYNNAEFLDDILERNNMEVNEENVIVDNYIFTIDREKLAVTKSLGKSQIKITSEVQQYLGKNENGKYEASLLLVIESNTNLKNIIIKNPDGTTFEMKTEEEKIVKDLIVEFDEEYTITVTTNDGKEETRKILEKSEEIIKTANELAEFRDNVNRGLTYEGKTIKLGNDIDLGSVCGENINGKTVNWKTIGYYYNEEDNNTFRGKFDGQYNIIKNLYINIDKNNIDECYLYGQDDYIYIGLFGYNFGTIENLIMENVNIYVDISNYSKAETQTVVIGAVVGESDNELKNIGVKSGNITCINTTKSTNERRSQTVGGIVGLVVTTNIYNCYNYSNIVVTNTIENEAASNVVGGIVGNTIAGSEIWNCYNTGNMEGNNCSNRLGGISGRLRSSKIGNSYNKGIITGQGGSYRMLGGIVGENGDKSTGIGEITNSYYTNTSAQYSNYENEIGKTTGIVHEETLKGYSQTLGTSFISDGKRIDKNGNVVDNLDSNGNTIYINNGYPILKWQVTENK